MVRTNTLTRKPLVVKGKVHTRCRVLTKISSCGSVIEYCYTQKSHKIRYIYKEEKFVWESVYNDVVD